jgi:hypothetical protein
MWMELICGVAIYRVICRFFSAADDTFDPNAVSGSSALFSVADRLEKIYGGKAYVGLRIPDADVCSRRDIDIVLVRKSDAMIVSVTTISDFVSIVEECKQQVEILESYLKQRNVILPEEYFSYKVVCLDPNFRAVQSNNLTSEVITYEQWMEMKPESHKMFSRLIKGVSFCGWKKETKEVVQRNLTIALSTAPMWDRVELKDDKYILGEFLEFKGFQHEVEMLRKIKRSKVSRLIFQQMSIFGFATPKLQVFYSLRDYRNDRVPTVEWQEISVSSITNAFFLPRGCSKVCKFKLASVVSMSLSA